VPRFELQRRVDARAIKNYRCTVLPTSQLPTVAHIAIALGLYFNNPFTLQNYKPTQSTHQQTKSKTAQLSSPFDKKRRSMESSSSASFTSLVNSASTASPDF